MNRLIIILGACMAVLLSLWLVHDGDGDQNDETVRWNEYWQSKINKRKNGYSKAEMPQIYSLLQRQMRTPVDRDQPEYGENYLLDELAKAKKVKPLKLNLAAPVFSSRGPGNIGGRTRALSFDPRDSEFNTWIAGSATGGVWKTTNGGERWEHLTHNLPNLGTNVITLAPSNPNVIYVGTGEHFTNDIDGSGIFRSSDNGQTWQQITDLNRYPDMKNISGIVVNPDNENEVIISSRNSIWFPFLEAAIYHTVDGGNSWSRLLSSDSERYDDLAVNPQNFNTLYVAVNHVGVLKSTDRGQSWKSASTGIQPSGRVEIDISPIDTSVLWASVEGTQSSEGSDTYISRDGANSWNILAYKDEDGEDYLGGQGWYDNTVKAHPTDANTVYVGGIDLFKFSATADTFTQQGFSVFEENTDFLSIVNGSAVGGGVYPHDSLTIEELLPIEIRFGQGTQLAHRFTVDFGGPGLGGTDYKYQDYVEVPFQVWDKKNERQIMVSFRDQQENGVWDLRSLLTDPPYSENSREYIIVHDISYSEIADELIALDGGQEHRQQYLIWPFLSAGHEFDADNLPVSTYHINIDNINGIVKNGVNISDAYGQYDNNNPYDLLSSDGRWVHPDQHRIEILPTANPDRFRLLVGNDGGVFVSDPSTQPGEGSNSFRFVSYRYNTSQFYAATKATGKQRYIGGMQDNSTWISPRNVTEGAGTRYRLCFGGDGFDVLWHPYDTDRIIGSIQFNTFRSTKNEGGNWESAVSGLTDVGQESGPFKSVLSHSRQLPDKVYTLGVSGVSYSLDFGDNWTTYEIDSLRWSFTNFAEVAVSNADVNVIWAGGILTDFETLYRSTDGGYNFKPVSGYDRFQMGRISGLATHPHDPNIAYALFSFAHRPKVLRTTDGGVSWHDISGFEESDTGQSARGFPDVATLSLFVFPDNTDRIWVGTEIGIVESQDGGQSWAWIESDMGAVPVSDITLIDDELVIPTYGRGIWSAQIEGVTEDLQYVPFIEGIVTRPSGETSLFYQLYQDYDSIQISVQDELVGNLDEITIGESSHQLNSVDLGDGNLMVQLIGWKNGQRLASNYWLYNRDDLFAAVTTYENDFDDNLKSNHFSDSDFDILTMSGFSDNALHSPHPYEHQKDIFAELRVPILIKGSQIFEYKDVAIVEPGETGFAYGSQAFYDYVVVQASRDGKEWTDIIDGYDCRYNDTWKSRYEGELPGRSIYFQTHKINLRDHFDEDEIIFLRFKLHADPAANGWGWAIDDIKVYADSSTPTIDISEDQHYLLYPNPTSQILYIWQSENIKSASLITVDGTVLMSQQRTAGIWEWNISSYPAGIYFVELIDKEGNNHLEKVIITR